MEPHPFMIDYGRDDCIIVAPKGNMKLFEKVMEEIRIAREMGLADPE